MIHEITSDLPTFKSLRFHPGLNVIIVRKQRDSSNKMTRNRAGKSSFVEIVHFLLGARLGKKSLFKEAKLINRAFNMTFDLGSDTLTVARSAKNTSDIMLDHLPEHHGFKKPFAPNLFGNQALANLDWIKLLGKHIFRLDRIQEVADKKPSFRSLFAYFARRDASNAFITPEKQASMQKTGDYQIALMYLLGLDWQIAREWQTVRDHENTLKELKKAFKEGALGSVVGKTSDLRTELTIKSTRARQLKAQLAEFKVLPEYRNLEKEADSITHQLNELANGNTLDVATIRDLQEALSEEAPPPIDDLQQIYAEAGLALPGVIMERYEKVQRFHESVIRNRKDYLTQQLQEAQHRIETRETQKEQLDKRRVEIMRTLQSHGALDQYSSLQSESIRLENEVEALRQRYQAAERIEAEKSTLDIERNRLLIRLKRDFAEQETRLTEAILAYENISTQLYESAGSMSIDSSKNGPTFDFPIQGERSKGIKNMKIFCFDMMLMQLCCKRGIGPGFLIHDNHLFDGVDGRQVISALKVGAETAEKQGFQYIVTLNEDDAFKEQIKGFDLEQYQVPVDLTDAKEDGGLFGIRI